MQKNPKILKPQINYTKTAEVLQKYSASSKQKIEYISVSWEWAESEVPIQRN
jgi:hypothetical protein